MIIADLFLAGKASDVLFGLVPRFQIYHSATRFSLSLARIFFLNDISTMIVTQRREHYHWHIARSWAGQPVQF